MRRTLRVPTLLAALALASSGLAAGAQASQKDAILICHGTASEKNPYVLISVDNNALAGHFDGSAPGHGANNHPDMLATADGTCGDDGGGGEE